MNTTLHSPTSFAHLTRELVLDVSAADDTARRVPAVISTEYPVPRDGYHEILLHHPSAIDLSRAPLPLIEQHGHQYLNIGIVENVRIEGRTLRGDVVFGQSDRANEVWPDVKAGIVRNLSVGYLVVEQLADGATVRVTRWQPFEVSLVSVPADPGAGLYRSISMTTPNVADHGSASAAAVDAARLAERSRVAEIQSLAAAHRSALPTLDIAAVAAIENGATVDAFRVRVLEQLADADRESGGHINRVAHPIYSTTASAGGRDFIDAASDALLLRAGVRITHPHAAARDLRGMTVLDMARACISRSGRSFAGDTPQAAIRSAMSTSDFPALLGDSLGKALRVGMENEQATHRIWCAVTEAADFRAQSRVILGSAPDLEQVLELGEYTNGPMAEDKTTLVPAKFGRIVSLSWESTLADNLGGFVNLGRSLGQAAMRVEADAVYSALIANALAGPTLADGTSLFDATRNNTVSVATGAGKPLTATALGAARAKLRRQTNVGGGLLNLVPRTLIVPPERETEAEILVASSTVHTGQANAETTTPAWIAGLIVVAEPRLANRGLAVIEEKNRRFSVPTCY